MIENTSGLEPVEYKVLVKPDEVKEKIGSIYIPETAQEQKGLAEVKGTLIAVGGRAFEDFGEGKPQPGQRVLFAKYGGKVVSGADGKTYRLLTDKDITCKVLDERAAVYSEVF